MQKNDPSNKDFYAKNTEVYTQKLQTLHQSTQEKVATIPQNQRLLITSHDAFSYFSKAYNMEVKGLQGISTVTEFGLRDVSKMSELITNRKIKAIFVESSVPSKSLEAVIAGCEQKGHPVRIGGTLFSDAMGKESTPEGTYIGMITYNINTIINALK